MSYYINDRHALLTEIDKLHRVYLNNAKNWCSSNYRWRRPQVGTSKTENPSFHVFFAPEPTCLGLLK